jgi:hypothetical protein
MLEYLYRISEFPKMWKKEIAGGSRSYLIFDDIRNNLEVRLSKAYAGKHLKNRLFIQAVISSSQNI